MTHDDDLVSASRVAIEASGRMLDALRRGLAESRRQVEATHAQIATSRAVILSTPCALLHRKRLPLAARIEAAERVLDQLFAKAQVLLAQAVLALRKWRDGSTSEIYLTSSARMQQIG